MFKIYPLPPPKKKHLTNTLDVTFTMATEDHQWVSRSHQVDSFLFRLQEWCFSCLNFLYVGLLRPGSGSCDCYQYFTI